jgi:hypothetical protein
MLFFGLRIKWWVFVKNIKQLSDRLIKSGLIANIVTLYSSTTILILK